ncbi:unnamed protein product, partial [Adineta steineri]
MNIPQRLAPKRKNVQDFTLSV